MQNLPLKFAIDTNVIINLAVAKYKDASLLNIKNHNIRKKTFEILEYLQNLIDEDKIELVITSTTYKEILNLNKLSKKAQKTFSPEELKYLQTYYASIRNLTTKYIKKTPNIKITYLDPKNLPTFSNMATTIAKAYSEPAQYTLKATPQLREKAFFLADADTPSNDAMIMAEATVCGLNLISFDSDITDTKIRNIPQIIRKINQDFTNDYIRPYRFLTLGANLKRLFDAVENTAISLPKSQFSELAPNIKYLSYRDFYYAVEAEKTARENQIAEKKECCIRQILFDFLEQSINSETNPANSQANLSLKATLKTAQPIYLKTQKALHGKLFQSNHLAPKNQRQLDDIRDQFEHI